MQTTGSGYFLYKLARERTGSPEFLPQPLPNQPVRISRQPFRLAPATGWSVTGSPCLFKFYAMWWWGSQKRIQPVSQLLPSDAVLESRPSFLKLISTFSGEPTKQKGLNKRWAPNNWDCERGNTGLPLSGLQAWPQYDRP